MQLQNETEIYYAQLMTDLGKKHEFKNPKPCIERDEDGELDIYFISVRDRVRVGIDIEKEGIFLSWYYDRKFDDVESPTEDQIKDRVDWFANICSKVNPQEQES